MKTLLTAAAVLALGAVILGVTTGAVIVAEVWRMWDRSDNDRP